MNLILMGAPGAGKGTQSERISEKWNIPAISTGEILRAAIKEETELGKQAKSLIEAGKLAPDEVVIAIIKETLSSESCANGFILDGFPRSIPQAEALDKMGVEIDAVISIEVADDKIVERMGGRRVCSGCGASYHTIHKPPVKEGVCDRCGKALITRKDDDPETVKERLQIYHDQTEPLKGYYASKGILKEVSGQDEIDATTALTFEVLNNI